MRNCMKWTYLGESVEVCDFLTFVRVHRKRTATAAAAGHDIHPFERWATLTTNGDTTFTFAAHTDSPITVVAPAAIGMTLRRWLERPTEA